MAGRRSRSRSHTAERNALRDLSAYEAALLLGARVCPENLAEVGMVAARRRAFTAIFKRLCTPAKYGFSFGVHYLQRDGALTEVGRTRFQILINRFKRDGERDCMAAKRASDADQRPAGKRLRAALEEALHDFRSAAELLAAALPNVMTVRDARQQLHDFNAMRDNIETLVQRLVGLPA